MTTEPEHTSLESLVEHTYQTWLWLDERVQAFPKAVRPQLGRRALDTILDALTSLSHAMYLPRGSARVRELEGVNRHLATLRLLLRGARDRRYLSLDQHEHAMRLVDECGRRTGGWLRLEREHARRTGPR
jgi:hypothetical protein